MQLLSVISIDANMLTCTPPPYALELSETALQPLIPLLPRISSLDSEARYTPPPLWALQLRISLPSRMSVAPGPTYTPPPPSPVVSTPLRIAPAFVPSLSFWLSLTVSVIHVSEPSLMTLNRPPDLGSR